MKRKVISLVLALTMALSMVSALGLQVSAAEGSVKYLQLKKVGTEAPAIDYYITKVLNNYKDKEFDAVSLQVTLKVDDIAGIDGILVQKNWANYGYLRADGEDGLKFVVNGADVTNADTGEAIPANTELTGMLKGKWYTWTFEMGMKAPYSSKVTVTDAETNTKVASAVWGSGSVGNMGFTLRANTSATVLFKDLELNSVTGDTKTLIEKREYKDKSAGAYTAYGDVDGLGGLGGNNSATLIEVGTEPSTDASVTYSVGTGGKLLKDGTAVGASETLTYGKYTYTVTPDEGYKVDKVTVTSGGNTSNPTLGADNSFEVTISADTSIAVAFVSDSGSEEPVETVLDTRNFESAQVDTAYTDSVGLGSVAGAATAMIRGNDTNKYLELSQTKTGNKLFYYAIKNLADYAKDHDVLVMDAKMKLGELSGGAGIKIWTWAQSFSYFSLNESKVKYDDISTDIGKDEWFQCKLTFDFLNSKLKFAIYDNDGNKKGEKTYDYFSDNAGNFAFEFDANTTGTFCLDDIVLTGIKGGQVVGPVIDQREFYVATNGSDSNDGSKDKPFLTVEKARETVRGALLNPNLEEGPITVNIRGGVYQVNDTISFSAADSGTEKNPVIYQAYQDEEVRFMGGLKVTPDKIVPVQDEEILKRVIDPTARKNLVQIDLGALGINEIPAIDDHGFGGNMSTSWQNYRPFEVYFNGLALTKSRYPNDEPGTGFLRTGNVITAGSTTAPFTVEYKDPDNRVSLWDMSKVKDLYISGFIGTDWAGVTHRVASLDQAKKTVTSVNGTSYPATVDHRLYFWNLVEEIDMPGESYIDRDKKIIYFYPPADTKNAEVTVASSDKVMFNLVGCKNITLKGFTCDTSRNRFINISSGENVTVEDCILARGSSNAISVGGTNCTVKGCHIYEMGRGGISVSGGDRATLTPASNVIENNRIHSFNRVYNSSVPGISITGVGQIIRNNAVYDAPHILIQLTNAPDTLLEYNEIYNGVLEASDIGAIYWGRTPQDFGLEIRYNYFHDIGNKYGGYGQQSVFYDDGTIGPYLHGNVFYRGTLTQDQGGTPTGSFVIKTHGGQYGRIENNIFIDSPVALRVQPWDSAGSQGKQTRWWTWLQNTVNPVTTIISKPWLDHYKGTQWEACQNVFSEASYNELMKLGTLNPTQLTKEQLDLAMKYAPGTTHTFKNNLTVGVPGYQNSVVWGAVDESNTMRIDNLSNGMSLFQNYDDKDFKLTSAGLAQVKAKIPEFQDIPFERMGLTSTVGGAEPTASNLSIRGSAIANATLTAEYQFADPDGDLQGNSKVTWYIGDSADGEFERIPGKQGKELLVDKMYAGRYIKFEVVPYDRNMMYGEAVMSEPKVVLGASDVDKTELLAAVDEAEQLIKDSAFGDGIGQYPLAAKEYLQSEIAAARTVLENEKALQYMVDQAAERMRKMIEVFLTQKNAGEIVLNEYLTDTENWVNNDVKGQQVGELRFENESVILDSQDTQGRYTRTTYMANKFSNEILTFKYKLDNNSQWAGIFFRQKNAETFGWDNNAGFGIIIKKDGFELQAYPNPGSIIATKENEYTAEDGSKKPILEDGKEYTVKVGAYDVGDSVQILFTIDDIVVFDFLHELEGGHPLIGEEGYISFSMLAGQAHIMPIYADKAKLQAKLDEVQSFRQQISAGSDYGQYSQDALNRFDSIITSALGVFNDKNATQQAVDAKVVELGAALEQLSDAKINTKTITNDMTVNLLYDLPESIFYVRNTAHNVLFQLDKDQKQPSVRIEADGTIGTVKMEIPYGTSLSTNGTWSGIIKAPTVSDTASVSVSGKISAVVATVPTGEMATSDKAVRIVLPGQKGKRVGYVENGSLKKISKELSADSQAAADKELGTNEVGMFTSGNDIILWTKLLTEFVTYSRDNSPTPTPDYPVIPTPGRPNNNTTIGSGSPGGIGVIQNNTTTQKGFADITGHWAEADIKEMAEAGIVSGVTPTQFEPERTVTRAEFAAMIVRALGIAATDGPAFEDVSGDAWFYASVTAAAKAGLIVGYDGYFRPDDLITREEMATIIAKAYVFAGGELPQSDGLEKFDDRDSIAEWAKSNVGAVTSLGLVSGMSDNTFAPQENATRAQAASLIKRLRDKIKD